MGGVQFVNPGDHKQRQAWDEAVRALPAGTVFHTTAWMDVVRQGLGLEPRFAYLPGRDGSVRALVPLFRAGGMWRSVRWLNIPQSCSSEPLAWSESDAGRLLEAVAAAAAADGAQAVLLRTAQEFRPAMPDGWEVRRESPDLRHTLDLAGAKDVERLPRARYNHRQNFRTLRRTLPEQGMEIRQVGRNEAGLFARVFHRVLLRTHGHLGYPARFFEALVRFLPEAARLTLAGPKAGPAVAYLLCIWSPPSCYLLYQGGVPTKEGKDAARWALGEEIEAAIRAGLQRFDMGETPPQNAGLIFYKEGWGAERTDGSYFVLARTGAASGLRVPGREFQWAVPVLRRLPVSLSLLIAGPVHRSLQ